MVSVVLLLWLVFLPLCVALCLRERAPFVAATFRNATQTIDFVLAFPTGNYDAGWGAVGFRALPCTGTDSCMANTNFYVFRKRAVHFAELAAGQSNGVPSTVTKFSNSVGLTAGASRLCCIHGAGIDVEFSVGVSPALAAKNLTILFAFAKSDWPAKHTSRGSITVSVAQLGRLGGETCLTPGGDDDGGAPSSSASSLIQWWTVPAVLLALR
jgi:hypothetical protein